MMFSVSISPPFLKLSLPTKRHNFLLMFFHKAETIQNFQKYQKTFQEEIGSHLLCWCITLLQNNPFENT